MIISMQAHASFLDAYRNVNETLPCLTVGTSQPPAINKHVYTPSPSVLSIGQCVTVETDINKMSTFYL